MFEHKLKFYNIFNFTTQQLYFNYTRAVFYLQPEFNKLIFVNNTTFVTTWDNSHL